MTSRPIDEFLTFLRDCEQRYHIAETTVQEATATTNDIHHDLELVDHADEEVLALGLELAQIRRKRREAKDTMSEIAPVLAWMDGNRAVIKGMEQLLGEVRKAERIAESRIYTPRTKRRAE